MWPTRDNFFQLPHEEWRKDLAIVNVAKVRAKVDPINWFANSNKAEMILRSAVNVIAIAQK